MQQTNQEGLDSRESEGRDGYVVHRKGYTPKPSNPAEVIVPPQGGTGETVPTTRPGGQGQGL